MRVCEHVNRVLIHPAHQDYGKLSTLKGSVFGLQGRGTDLQAVADPWRLQIHV